MAKTEDYNARAAAFLKAWQKQMTEQMREPDMIAAMLAAMNAFGAKANDENPRKSGHAPDAGDAAIRKLAGRVERLEHELSRVHAQLLSMDAETKKPARAKHRRDARAVAATKRTLAKRKQSPVGKPKPKGKRR